MKLLKVTSTLSLFLFSVSLFAQGTGPGGIVNTNLSARWKADIGITLTTGKISTWADQTGNGNNLTQGTAANRPIIATSAALNGQTVVRYTGVDHFNSAFSGPNSAAMTLFLVANGSDYASLFRFQNVAGTYVVYPYTLGGNTFIASTEGGVGGGITHGLVANTNNVGAARYTVNATNGMQTYLNGVVFNQKNSTTGNLPNQLFYSGMYSGGGEKPTCDVGELIWYNRQLNEAEMIIVSNYLASKYNVTLNAGAEKYVGDTPGNGDYDFEVIGIGRSAGGNSTGASSSVSGGLEITEGTTAFDNNEYLHCGHTIATNYMDFYDLGGMSAGSPKARWARIWYLDWTHVGGGTETANLIFDFTDGGMSPTVPAGAASNYKLLYRAGQTGNWTEVPIVATYAGDRVTFANVPYTTGVGYYTIGTLNNTSSPLPIELTSFDAFACNNEICLEWITSSETMNKSFTIERSINGIDFETLVTVEGAGTSKVTNNYSVVDPKPLKGLSYYRLKQTDINGQISSFDVRSVNLELDQNFNVFPSPNNGDLITVAFDSGPGENVLINIYDVSGKEVMSRTINASGKNTAQSIELKEKLFEGIYFVTATIAGKKYGKKIIVK